MSVETARERLINLLPHIKLSVEMQRLAAGPGAKVCLAVLLVNADNTGGKVACRFEQGDFFDDLAEVLGGEIGWLNPKPKA